MSTIIHQRVEAAKRGENPAVVAKLSAGWVVLGDTQHLRGYALLLPDPVVPTLNDLRGWDRARFLVEMSAVGDALLQVTDAFRINYSILGNAEPALHAHVFPRYEAEPEHRRLRPVWSYPPEERDAVPFDLERDRFLMQALHGVLAGAKLAEEGVFLPWKA